MFETQYNAEMEREVLRLEAVQRAVAAGHPHMATEHFKSYVEAVRGASGFSSLAGTANVGA